MQVKGEFDELVGTFFNEKCGDPFGKGTFWLIKLTTSPKKAETSARSKGVFGAIRNHSQGGPHTEELFIEWWTRYLAQMRSDADWTHDSLEVYTNFTPCTGCAPKLRKWANENGGITLTIHYAFVYIDFQQITAPKETPEYYEQLKTEQNASSEALRGLISHGRPVQILKLTAHDLSSLANDFEFRFDQNSESLDKKLKVKYTNQCLEEKLRTMNEEYSGVADQKVGNLADPENSDRKHGEDMID